MEATAYYWSHPPHPQTCCFSKCREEVFRYKEELELVCRFSPNILEMEDSCTPVKGSRSFFSIFDQSYFALFPKPSLFSFYAANLKLVPVNSKAINANLFSVYKKKILKLMWQYLLSFSLTGYFLSESLSSTWNPSILHSFEISAPT